MNLKPCRRVLLKVSGETLLGSQPFGIDQTACRSLALAIKEFRDAGIETSIVIGGGNIFRGISLKELGMARTPADQMGMLATLLNGIALKQALESIGCKAKLFTALECPRVAETYTWEKAYEAIASGSTLIFVGGTGNPYFTTDTAAAMRASEIQADMLLKATKVDGVYDKDPLKHAGANLFSSLNYSQVLAQNLQVMDATSIALCRSSGIPILVFNMKLLGQGKVKELLSGQCRSTIISEES